MYDSTDPADDIAVNRTIGCRRIHIGPRHLARAETIADGIVTAAESLASGCAPDAAYPPRPGPHCSWCDVRRHCPPGQAAAPRREPWDALGELP